MTDGRFDARNTSAGSAVLVGVAIVFGAAVSSRAAAPVPAEKSTREAWNPVPAYCPTGMRRCGDSCFRGACAVTIVSSKAPCTGVAVNNGRIFWAQSDGTVGSVRADGSGRKTIASGQGQLFGLGVNNRYVFWSNRQKPAVMKAPLEGGPSSVVTEGSSGFHFAADEATVYWTDADSERVLGAPVDGGAVVTIAASAKGPAELALDSESVYWLDRDLGEVRKAPRGGGPSVTLADGQESSEGGIAVDRTRVYWANAASGEIFSAPLDGGTRTTLTSLEGTPAALTVDSEYVYWVNQGGHPNRGDGASPIGAVKKVPKDGGAVVTLAWGQSSPSAIAIDGTSVYWTNNGAPNGAGASVVKLTPK